MQSLLTLTKPLQYPRNNTRAWTPHKRASGKEQEARACKRTVLLALLLSVGLGLLLLLPLGPASRFIPIAQAHAELLRSDPAANAILRVPPSRIRLWFNDELLPATSGVSVLNTANRVVDNRDSQVSPSNARELSVTLPSLPAGVYTVFWRAQSNDDAHVTAGSFAFSIARPDGSVPPVPVGSSPVGNSTGAGNDILDGPTLVQTLAAWLALLFMTFWVGGLIWETWILPPGTPGDPDLQAVAWTAVARFRRLSPYALGCLVVVNGGIVLAQGAVLAANWSGAWTPSLLGAMLFGSRFGFFWWMREGVVLAALGLGYATHRRGRLAHRGRLQANQQERRQSATPALSMEPQPSPVARHARLTVLRHLLYLPMQLVQGWHRRSWSGKAELFLAALLLVAFALSGHLAAVPASEFGYALSVDLLHLLTEAAWVGGLFYISVVLVPAMGHLSNRQHAHVLVHGLPRFSVVALVSFLVLATTGSLNTTIRLTSLQQLLTTPYGWVLTVKIEFFLLMALISAYHAFVLRPRLAHALSGYTNTTRGREQAPATVGRTHVQERGAVQIESSTPLGSEEQDEELLPARAQRLVQGIESWTRREALLGMAVLLCVAFLSALAGSLAPPI